MALHQRQKGARLRLLTGAERRRQRQIPLDAGLRRACSRRRAADGWAIVPPHDATIDGTRETR